MKPNHLDSQEKVSISLLHTLKPHRTPFHDPNLFHVQVVANSYYSSFFCQFPFPSRIFKVLLGKMSYSSVNSSEKYAQNDCLTRKKKTRHVYTGDEYISCCAIRGRGGRPTTLTHIFPYRVHGTCVLTTVPYTESKQILNCIFIRVYELSYMEERKNWRRE